MFDVNLIFHYLELAAALMASYYWLKTKDKSVRPFVWYLWFTVFVETLAMYTYLYDHFDNPIINWIDNSVFHGNTWLYNIYNSASIVLIGLFMIRNIKNQNSHKIIKIIIIVWSLFIVTYFLFSGTFFKMYLPYDMPVQTLMVFIMVLLYLRELIQSDEILDFYKSHVFYISIGLLLWYICLTPLFIFDGFYRAHNINFNAFRTTVLDTFNIILYSCYVFAFLYSLYHKKILVKS